MILGFSMMLGIGFIFGELFERVKIPRLIGYLVSGVIIGPQLLNICDESILAMSDDLRKICLMIILFRAGIGLDSKKLKQHGVTGILLSVLPATFEIIMVTILAPLILGFNYLESALLGCVLAAVSPAVIVPLMLDIKARRYGEKKGIPDLVMAAASLDDIYILIIFSSLLTIASGTQVIDTNVLMIVLTFFLNIIVSLIVAYIAFLIIKNVKHYFKANWYELLIFAFLLFLVGIESIMTRYIPYSSMLSVIVLGILIREDNPEYSKTLSKTYQDYWRFAEIILFSLVGTRLQFGMLIEGLLNMLVLLVAGLLARCLAVLLALSKSTLSNNERVFVMLSYIPKATVQAAIGGIPLSLGIGHGEQILALSVLAIVMTAPLGAVLIERSYPKLLDQQKDHH